MNVAAQISKELRNDANFAILNLRRFRRRLPRQASLEPPPRKKFLPKPAPIPVQI
jgi:hypothetical protein